MKVFKAFITTFEAPKRSVKIKIQVNFFPLSRIGTGRVNAIFIIFFEVLLSGL